MYHSRGCARRLPYYRILPCHIGLVTGEVVEVQRNHPPCPFCCCHHYHPTRDTSRQRSRETPPFSPLSLKNVPENSPTQQKVPLLDLIRLADAEEAKLADEPLLGSCFLPEMINPAERATGSGWPLRFVVLAHRHRQCDGPGDVHHHRRHGRAGIIADQRACHRRNAGRGSAWQTHRKTAELHRKSSARSWRSPPQPTSAFGRSRPESPGAQAAAWSVRSPSGLASPHRHPCDHFLHVS